MAGEMHAEEETIRSVTIADLAAANRVVEAAIMTWNLPERVKRLSLPTYRYDQHDLEHYEIFAAARGDEILGIVACDAAEARDAPQGKKALLIHGLYVHPSSQRRGIGRRLLERADALARKHGYDGLLVKAQAGAETFFERHGFSRLPVENPDRQYERRYWKAIA